METLFQPEKLMISFSNHGYLVNEPRQKFCFRSVIVFFLFLETQINTQQGLGIKSNYGS